MRLALFVGSLVLALVIGVWSSQVPPPRTVDAPATAFSAERAMVDVREIAQRPHAIGTPEHARVRQVLVDRLTALGLSPALQSGTLSPQAIQRLERWQDAPVSPDLRVTNIVGRLPGRDRSQPAVLMMAHYDTTWISPGAADDSTGVAAILEAVRAIRARGPIERDLVVLFTDAEELNLDGARAFFSEHPWRDRVGMVVNVEARGGGGRASMFETGIGNTPTIRLFGPAAVRADGGTTASSLAGFIYDQMPNGTDYTIARDRGIQGLNFAFVGRPSHYHTAESTPDALDPGAVQHIGSQVLEVSDRLLRVDALPGIGPDRVYADLLGQVVIQHAPATGWILLGLAALLFGVAAWRSGQVDRAGLTEIGRGLLGGLWLIAMGLVVLQVVRLLAGPSTSRAASAEAYYTLLARLPWMEVASGLAILGLVLVTVAGRNQLGARFTAIGIAALTSLGLILGGVDVVLIGAGLIAVGLGLWRSGQARSTWGAWLGLIALVLILAVLLQALAPPAAYLFVWTGLVATAVAALTAVLDARLDRPAALVPAALATVLVGAWLAGLAHFFFLAVGMDLPGALMLLVLLILTTLLPLAPRMPRPLLALAAACLILAGGIALSARVAEPMAARDGSVT